MLLDTADWNVILSTAAAMALITTGVLVWAFERRAQRKKLFNELRRLGLASKWDALADNYRDINKLSLVMAIDKERFKKMPIDPLSPFAQSYEKKMRALHHRLSNYRQHHAVLFAQLSPNMQKISLRYLRKDYDNLDPGPLPLKSESDSVSK